MFGESISRLKIVRMIGRAFLTSNAKIDIG